MSGKHLTKKLRYGIYPLIVKVLLVAIALVLILTIVNYIFSLVTSTREYFELKPLLYVTYSGLNPVPILTVYAHNDGASSETLLRVEIITGGGSYLCRKEVRIEAGFRGQIVIVDSSFDVSSLRQRVSDKDKIVLCDWEVQGTNPQIVGGNFYTVKLYTARHGIMTLDVICQET